MKELVRTVDELGRIVLPADFRALLGLEIREKVTVALSGDTILIRKS